MNLGSVYVGVRGKTDQYKRDLAKAKTMTGKAAVVMQKQISNINFKALGVAALAFSATLGGATKKVVALGREFEATMKTVQAWSGASGNELKQLTSIAREMGATTEHTATQAAGALKFLAAAGFTAKQSIAALPGTLDLATSAQVNLSLATDITTDTMTAFGMKVENLSKVNDAFIVASTGSNTTVEMLGESMRYAAPMAKLMGYNVEQTAAMLGALAGGGIKASMAGAGLNMIMLKSAQYIKTAGIEGLTFIGLLKLMKKEQWDAAKIGKVFGARQVKTADVLASQISLYEKLHKKMQESGGITQKLAAIMRDGLDNELKILNSTIQDEMLTAFEYYKDDMRDIIQFTTNWIKANDDLIHQKLNEYIDKTKNSLKGIVDLYNSLPEGVVGAAGFGVIGTMLFGPRAGAVIAMIALTSDKISQFKRDNPEIFGEQGVSGIRLFSIDENTEGWDEYVASWYDYVDSWQTQAKDMAAAAQKNAAADSAAANALNVATAAEKAKIAEIIAAKIAEIIAAKKAVIKIDKELNESRIAAQEEYTDFWELQAKERYEVQLRYLDLIIKKDAEATAQQKGHAKEYIDFWLLKARDRDAVQARTWDAAIAEATKYKEFWEHTLESIQDATANAVYNILDDWSDGFKGLFDNIMDWFKRLLSQMVAQAAMTRIIVPVLTSAGVMGATSAVAGESGGGLGLPSGSGLGDWVNNSPFNGGISDSSGTGVLSDGRGALTEWGTTWGNLMSYAALAYNAVGFINDLSDGNYFAAGGTAAGGIIGGIVGGPVGAAIGSGLGKIIGNLIGGLLGGGDKMPDFRLTDLVQASINDQLFDVVEGFEALNWDKTMSPKYVGSNKGHYKFPIAEAYANMVEILQQDFNEMVFSLSEILPEEIRELTLNNLAQTDFAEILTEASQGKWDLDEAEDALAGVAADYAEGLAVALGNAYATALSDYISSNGVEGLIGDAAVWNMLQDSVQDNIGKMYQNIAEQIRGGDFAGGLSAMGEIDTFISNLAAAMAPITEIIATAGLTDYELAIRAINREFDVYAATLEAAGVDLEKYTDLEVARQIKLAEAAAALAEAQRALDIQLMEAQGNAAEALAMARADELAAMDESLRATQLLIWAAQDAADATQKLADAMAAATNLSASLAASINNIKYGQSYGYHQTLESNLQTIAGMTGIPEKYRQHLIDQAMEYYDLQMDSLSAAQDTAAYSTQTSRAQLDILEALESTITEWKDTYDDLANQILGYKTTTANPQDVVERLAIAKQAIMDVTGGMSAMDYVASLGTPEEQAAAIQILQNLYDNYLNLAQEAYQRPSSEYQAIYAETMGELSTLLSYMESYSESEWQISIDQLNALYDIRAEIERLQAILNPAADPPSPQPDPGPSIPDWLTSQYSTIYNDFLEALNSGSPGPGSKVDLSEMYGPGASAEWFEGGIMKFITTEGETFWYDAMTSLFDIFLNNPDIAAGWAERYGSGSFAAGGYVPETGLAYVHEGEYITPKGYDYPEMQGNNVTFQLNITGNDQPQEVGKVVKNELSSFMRSGEGRKLIQSTAKGR